MNESNTINDSTLIINLNEEYKIKIEEAKNFDTSIFKEVYEEALKNVVEIVNQSSKNGEYDDFNNIIAFTGERGKGKSSSMISFRNVLVSNVDNKKEWKSLKNSSVLGTKFAQIDIVDPSLFRGEESLFEIILAQMFQKFQLEINETNCKLNDDDRRNIIKQFQEVFENLQIIKADRKDLYKKDSIEVLSRLATSSNLRDCFRKLVITYLEKFEKFGKDEGFLVIAIDDFDLNISGTYEMLEDIRQFLIQSNIIILIACKLEQLQEVVELYYKDKKITINPEFKAKKYIDKMIPFGRRLLLPDLKVLSNTNMKVVSNNNILFQSKCVDFKIIILKIIYDQTGLIQPLNRLNQNSIIPETLRQTQSFINILFGTNQLYQLKNYLIQEKLIDKDIYSLLTELDEVNDDLFLLILSKKLIKLYTEKVDDQILGIRPIRNRKSTAFRIINNTNIPDRISIGDIVYLLREYENDLKVDNYQSIKDLSILKAIISLRINNIVSTDKGLYKYSLINEYVDVLPTENRNSFEFNKIDIASLNSLNEEIKIFFSLWIQYLGAGFPDYRNKLDKDIIEPNYTSKGGISPINTLNNIHNLDIFSKIFEFDIHNDLCNELKKWNENSTVVKQFSNPSFTLKVIDHLKSFRALEVKESLPDNYFDTVSLLFVYGLIFSLSKIEDEYLIEGLVENYIDNPLVKETITNFNLKGYSYKSTSVLKKKYNLDFKIKYDISQLAEIINDLYEKNNIDDNNTKNELNALTIDEMKVLTDLISILETRKVTSRAVGNRLDIIRETRNVRLLELIAIIDRVKYELNRHESYEVTKNEIIELIKHFING